ncbi:hypothetical protein SLA2020_427910 [Shorea laevis]
MATAHRHLVAFSRPAKASMWPLSVASNSKEHSSKPHKAGPRPSPQPAKLAMPSTLAALGPQQQRPCTHTAHGPQQPIHHATLIHLQAIHQALSTWLGCTTHSFNHSQLKTHPGHALAWWSARMQGTSKLPP